jgi:hypothetical protein
MKTSTALTILCLFLATLVVAPHAYSASENLVQDPGFEKGGDEWDDWGSTEIVKNNEVAGKYALRCGPGAGGRAQELAGVEPEKHYSLSFHAKMSETNSHANIGLSFKDTSGNTIAGYSWQAEVSGTNYQNYSFSVTSPPEFDHVTLYTWKDTGMFYLYADEFIFEEK